MMRKVFVFGSNLLGIHGAGAAKHAAEVYGAIRGQGKGFQGHSYAIPTKATPWESLSLTDIEPHVAEFITFAREHPELQFEVTPIGTGFAGHTVQGIAPMFKDAQELSNVYLPPMFVHYLLMQSPIVQSDTKATVITNAGDLMT